MGYHVSLPYRKSLTLGIQWFLGGISPRCPPLPDHCCLAWWIKTTNFLPRKLKFLPKEKLEKGRDVWVLTTRSIFSISLPSPSLFPFWHLHNQEHSPIYKAQECFLITREAPYFWQLHKMKPNLGHSNTFRSHLSQKCLTRPEKETDSPPEAKA